MHNPAFWYLYFATLKNDLVSFRTSVADTLKQLTGNLWFFHPRLNLTTQGHVVLSFRIEFDNTGICGSFLWDWIWQHRDMRVFSSGLIWQHRDMWFFPSGLNLTTQGHVVLSFRIEFDNTGTCGSFLQDWIWQHRDKQLSCLIPLYLFGLHY